MVTVNAPDAFSARELVRQPRCVRYMSRRLYVRGLYRRKRKCCDLNIKTFMSDPPSAPHFNVVFGRCVLIFQTFGKCVLIFSRVLAMNA